MNISGDSVDINLRLDLSLQMSPIRSEGNRLASTPKSKRPDSQLQLQGVNESSSLSDVVEDAKKTVCTISAYCIFHLLKFFII